MTSFLIHVAKGPCYSDKSFIKQELAREREKMNEKEMLSETTLYLSMHSHNLRINLQISENAQRPKNNTD
jgi:hypothetical protein